MGSWESFASPVLNTRTRLAGHPSFLDTSPRKGPLGKMTPRQVLASLVLVLATISCLLVLFYLTLGKMIPRQVFASLVLVLATISCLLVLFYLSDVGDKDRVVEQKHSFRSYL